MKTFSTSREIPSLPGNIFAAISHPERLAKWWGPAGFTNTFSQFQFITGGKWSFIMHGPDGVNYVNDSEFAEIIPNEKVVIRHISEPRFTLTISLTNSAKGTLVLWNQEFDNAEVAEQVAHIVIPSNEQNLDRLTEEVCGK
ncbi:MAG: SRPBCC domain-containing protein [Bacteroidales bacterium]|nr:SRPBCC domain-containing protein [Bacteroidales bacterium]